MEVYSETADHEVPHAVAASPGPSGEKERLHGLLREATRLIERSDLARAGEKLREASELAAGRDARPGEDARR